MLKLSGRFYFIFGVALILLLFLTVMIIGFPKPIKIMVNERIPRIPWLYAIDNANNIYDTYNDPYFVSLLTDNKGAIVASRSRIFNRTLYYQKSNRSSISRLRGIPNIEQLSQVTPIGNELDLLFLMRDESKTLQLYHYDQSAEDYTKLTSIKGGVHSYIFSPNDSIVFYNSKINDAGKAFFQVHKMNLKKEYEVDIVYSSESQVAAVDWHVNKKYLLIKHANGIDTEGLEILTVGDNDAYSKFRTQVEEGKKYKDPLIDITGAHIFYMSSWQSDFVNLHRLSIGTELDTSLTKNIGWDLEEFTVLPNNNVIININEDGFSNLLKFDSKTCNYKKLKDIPWGKYRIIPHQNKNKLGLNIIQAYDKKIMYEVDLDKKDCQTWNDNTRTRMKYPKPELIKYPSFDSTLNKSRFLSAIVYKRLSHNNLPRPVVIKIHGGPPQQSRPYYGLDSKILDDGVVLIEPNLRGSTGYGKKFEKLDNSLNRHHSVDDIGALLDWIEEQPELDEKRVAISGGSYGGYIVLASLIKYGKRLSCGINHYGINSFINLVEETESEYLDAVRNEYGDERNHIERMYLDNISPINRMNEIRNPLFIYHGVLDNLVRVDQSRRAYSILQEDNTNIWYIEAMNEGHGLRNPWNYLFIAGAQYVFLQENLQLSSRSIDSE